HQAATPRQSHPGRRDPEKNAALAKRYRPGQRAPGEAIGETALDDGAPRVAATLERGDSAGKEVNPVPGGAGFSTSALSRCERVIVQPFFQVLQPARRVLLAGAGGGFDNFCGLPLFFALRDAGKECFLANLSFSRLDDCGTRRLGPVLHEVTADGSPPGYINYFPELYLAQWFRRQGEEIAVFALERTGVVPLRQAYENLLERLQFDTLLLVDGGTDSLMRGDEWELG